MKNFIRAWLSTVLLICLSAHAGNESHGGDIVLCEGKNPVVLDYYHAALPAFGETISNIVDISDWSKEKTVLYLKNQLGGYLFRFDIEAAYLKIGPLETWIQSDLKEVDDSNEPYFLPKGCERKQGAVRQGDQVFVDPTYVAKLSPAQLGILEFHEAAFYVANKRKILTSEGVRNLVRALLQKAPPEHAVVRAIKTLGSRVYSFELLLETFTARGYQPTSGSSPLIVFTLTNPETRRLEARLMNPSGIMMPFPPAIFQCDASGTTCEITSSTGENTGSVLSMNNVKFKILDGGRIISFYVKGNDETILCSYFRYFEPEFPFNGRK